MKLRRPRTLIGYLLFVYGILVVVAVVAFVNHSRNVLGLNKTEEQTVSTIVEPITDEEEEKPIDLDEVLSDFDNNVISTNIDNVKIIKEYSCSNGDAVYKIENNSDERVFARDIKLCYYSLENKEYIKVDTYPKKVYIPAESFTYLYVYNEKASVPEGYTLEKSEINTLSESNFITDAVQISKSKRYDDEGVLVTGLMNIKDTPIISSELLIVFFKGEEPVGVAYGAYNSKMNANSSGVVIIPYPTNYKDESVIKSFDSFKIFCLHSRY